MADKWDKVESLVRKQDTALSKAGVTNQPLAPINEQIQAIREQELDIIGRFKRNSIERKAALEAMRSMYDARLESSKHALMRAVDVEKKRVDVVANKYIFQITEEYLNNLRELGLQNFESRFNTLLQLNQMLARLTEQAMAQDVPPSVRDATIENITKKYREFSDKLMEEEINLSK